MFYLKILNISLKILDTTITVTRFIFHKTHQSHARSQKLCWTYILKEWIQKLLFETFFLTSNKSVITFNQYMFNCKCSITSYTNRSLFFSQNKWMWPVCNLFKTVFSFLVLQKDNSFPESLGKLSWKLFDIKPASSHSLCQTSQTYLEVNGFRSEKGTRPAVGSV